MIGELKLLETVEIPHKTNYTFNSHVAEDGKLAFRIPAGTYIINLVTRKENILPNLFYKKMFIPIEDYDISNELGIKFDRIYTNLSKNELYEAMFRSELSNSSNILEPIEKCIQEVKWSPVGLHDNTKSLLAVLNSTGSLNIYQKIIDKDFFEKYSNIINITEKFISITKSDWKEPSKDANIYEELNSRAEQVKPATFEWGNVLKSKQATNFAYFISAFSNGDLTFWTINENNNSFSSTFVSKFSLNMDISYLKWQHSDTNGVLFIGCHNGEIYSLETQSLDKELQCTNLTKICADSNEVKVKYMQFFYYEKSMFLVALKEPYLLVYLIAENGDIKDAITYHIGNYLLADVQKIAENKFILLACSGECQEVVLETLNGKINFQWRFIYINLNWSKRKAIGFNISPNNFLFNVFTVQSRLNVVNKEKEHIHLTTFINSKIPFEDMLENIQGLSIRKHLDILEYIRYKAFSEQVLPINIEHEEKKVISNMPVAKLKVLAFKLNIKEFLLTNPHLEESWKGIKYVQHSIVEVTYKIKLAMERVKALFGKRKQSPLSVFQMQSLNLTNIFIKETLMENALARDYFDVDFTKDLLHLILEMNSLLYPEMPVCFYCKESISGTRCQPEHYDVRCSISHMQVDPYQYLECYVCKRKIHVEVTKEYEEIYCPFCDATVDRVTLERPATRREAPIDL